MREIGIAKRSRKEREVQTTKKMNGDRKKDKKRVI